uniref:SFRICE_015091 n=1 Tax=Spodoptera frugiperda TaxID=7108 RepID=A0A2H1VY33_SPOFR
MAFSLLFILVLFIDLRQVICQKMKTMIVDTEQGQIEGYLASVKTYYEFCGIRYAVTKSRFTAPEEPPKHKGVFKAEDRLVFCPQFQAQDIFAKASENEDCLILNVYVPIWLNSPLVPVMVFLHGGDFGVGSSSPTFYGPKFIMPQEVIVVTVNYRLNAFGFLNLGTKEAPGNAGLKDIRAALRWVQKNIRNFGGNDRLVTVVGQGSGGMAAVYLTLSKSCRGLFHRIISSSGTLFSAKSFDPFPLATASQVAKALGLNSVDPEKLTALYMNVSINKLEEAISHQMNAKSTFLPSVEQFLDDEPFLTDTPLNLMLTKNFYPVPALFGINSVEGVITVLDYYTFTSQTNRLLNGDYSVLDQRNLKVPGSLIGQYRGDLMKIYFPNVDTEQAATGSLIQFNTDFLFLGPMTFLMEIYKNNSNVGVFHYIFEHKGKRNLGTLLTGTSGLPSTTNLDDMFYVFDIEKPALYMDKDDATIVAFMVGLWTTFAKRGHPTPDVPEEDIWLPYPKIIKISIPDAGYTRPLNEYGASLWRDAFDAFGREIN